MAVSSDYVGAQPERLGLFVANLKKYEVDPIEVGDVEDLKGDYSVVSEVEYCMEVAEENDQSWLTIDKSNKPDNWIIHRIIGYA